MSKDDGRLVHRYKFRGPNAIPRGSSWGPRTPGEMKDLVSLVFMSSVTTFFLGIFVYVDASADLGAVLITVGTIGLVLSWVFARTPRRPDRTGDHPVP